MRRVLRASSRAHVPTGLGPEMRPREGGRGEHLLAASAWLYEALLVLYPKAFRRRYEAEMSRDFRELSREGLQVGGSTELMRVWVQAFSDLVLTALKERIAVRAMVVAVVLVAVAVTSASLLQTPTYEASALVLVDEGSPAQGTGNGKIQLIPLAPTPETL
jgi:hypothetical protein